MEQEWIVLMNGKTPTGTKVDVVAWMPLPEPCEH